LGRPRAACPIASNSNYDNCVKILPDFDGALPNSFLCKLPYYNPRRAEALKTVVIIIVGVNLTAIEANVLRLNSGKFATLSLFVYITKTIKV
jgi:hypothetical protein